MELVAGVAVAIAALALVLEPLVRPTRAAAPAAADDLDEFEPLEESDSPKVQALLALKEIEFDRATGKLSDEDYAQLTATYSRRALEAMDREAAAEQVLSDAVAGGDPAEALIQRARAQLRMCSVCGPRPEADATFCSECGRGLTARA